MWLFLWLGLFILGAIVFQYFTREVSVRFLGPIHRDDSPVVYWSMMVVELGLAVLMFYIAATQ